LIAADTRRGEGPHDRGRPSFGAVLITYTQADERSERSVDLAKGEATEKELDVFIAKRDAQRRKAEGDRPVEEAWKQSSRIHDAKLRRENTAAWIDYHQAAAERARRNLEELIARHEAQAQKLLGIEADGDLPQAKLA
jgi:hypothetical protein